MKPKATKEQSKIIKEMLRVAGESMTKAGDHRLPNTLDDLETSVFQDDHYRLAAWIGLARWVQKQRKK